MMKIIELRDIKRENEHIHYRKRYSAVLVYTIDGTTEHLANIIFVFEYNALGSRKLIIQFEDPINYPLLPAKKKLEEYLLTRFEQEDPE